MIDIEKEVTVMINGADVQSLRDVCEMARRYIKDNKFVRGMSVAKISISNEWEIGEYDNKAYCRMTNFLDKVFNNT